MTTDDWSLPRLADRLAIQDVLARYGRAVDRIHLRALSAIFHPDAVIDSGGNKLTVEEFVANVGRRHLGVPVGFHMVASVMIDFVRLDRAFVESYALAFEQHPAIEGQRPAVDRLGRVRYGDIFERRAGFWRIAHRITVSDHVSLVSVDPTVVDPIPASAKGSRYRGVRGSEDPILKARATLGIPLD